MVLKRCSKCAADKPASEFHKHKNRKDGLNSTCKVCTCATVKLYRDANPSKIRTAKRTWMKSGKYRDYQRTWRIHNRDKDNGFKFDWAKRNPEKVRTSSKRWSELNPEKIITRRRRHYRLNKKRYVAYVNQRRAAKLNATPKWADLEAIRRFYENCPPGMVVDHIYPLQGKTVCGLHIVSNLQYLTPLDNQRKYNRLPETLANVGV